MKFIKLCNHKNTTIYVNVAYIDMICPPCPNVPFTTIHINGDDEDSRILVKNKVDDILKMIKEEE